MVILREKATRLTFHTNTHVSLRRTCSNVYDDYQAFHQDEILISVPTE